MANRGAGFAFVKAVTLGFLILPQTERRAMTIPEAPQAESGAPQEDAVWNVPVCGPVKRHMEPRGVMWPLRFVIPRHMKIIRKADVDYEESWLLHKVRGDKYYMRIMYGIYASTGGPSPDLYNASVSVRRRHWGINGKPVGADFRGELRDGTRWRYVGIEKFEFAEYTNVTASVALAFDEVLDSMCFYVPKEATPTQKSR